MSYYYSNILSPIRIGDVVFKNRIFAAPSALQALSTADPWPSENAIAHYEARAKSGAACVTCVGASVVPYTPYPGNTAWDMDNPQALNRMALLARRIHAHGAKASMELGVVGIVRTGLVVSEGVPNIWNAPGKEMTKEDISGFVEGFAKAAEALLRCGYDMILLHFGHGMPVAQFMSPLTNRRTDEYGGSFENRCRFADEVIDAIRAQIGHKMLIDVRISGSELEPGGIELEEAIEFTKHIQDRVDMVQISVGLHNPKWFTTTHPCGFLPSAPNIYLAEAVKQAGVTVPVAGIGGISDLDEAEDILASNKVDILYCCRGIIADENLVNKAYSCTPDDVRPCVKCMRCHDSVVFERQFHCTVNPRVGLEADLPTLFEPAKTQKKVAVIGGGPAGMEAALIAHERGHNVTIYEKNSYLGGTIVFADYVPFKYPLHNFKEYLIHQVEKKAIAVILNTEATPELLAKKGFDEIILAVGANPIKLSVPGIESNNTLLPSQVYGNEDSLPNTLAVIGGGQVGCETALHLARMGKKVSIIEMQDKVAPDASPTHRNELIAVLYNEPNLTILTESKCSEITESGVAYVDGSGDQQFAEAEAVIIAVGSRSDFAQVDRFLKVFPQARPIGDCCKVATVEQAIESAFIAGNNL